MGYSLKEALNAPHIQIKARKVTIFGKTYNSLAEVVNDKELNIWFKSYDYTI